MRRFAFYQTLFALTVCSWLLPSDASAKCLRAATAEALNVFTADPVEFMRTHGSDRDVGVQVAALASEAVNLRDKTFGKSLALALGVASADDGKAIGAALADVGRVCSDPNDPSDSADKEYIATEIVANIATNEAASVAYGLALGETQTAAVDGGGDTSGVGGQLGALPDARGSSGLESQSSSATPNRGSSSGSTGVGGGGVVTSATNTTPGFLTFGTILTGANSVSAN